MKIISNNSKKQGEVFSSMLTSFLYLWKKRPEHMIISQRRIENIVRSVEKKEGSSPSTGRLPKPKKMACGYVETLLDLSQLTGSVI